MRCFDRLEHNFDTVKRLGLHDVLNSQGFTRFKLRCAGRYDFQIDALEAATGPFEWLRDPPWMPLVRAILAKHVVHQLQARSKREEKRRKKAGDPLADPLADPRGPFLGLFWAFRTPKNLLLASKNHKKPGKISKIL